MEANERPLLTIELAVEAPADLNEDGRLDFLDWEKFRMGHLADLSAMTLNEAYLRGDLDGDLDNDEVDFAVFKQLYEHQHGAGAFTALLKVTDLERKQSFCWGCPQLLHSGPTKK
ncbi:hypothetical protein [Aeoliella sp.]|uniref:hypothetical protein n=1 Tax=Aeoliella sp. TaxID=2795800 RepID=UPI003CCC33C2